MIERRLTETFPGVPEAPILKLTEPLVPEAEKTPLEGPPVTVMAPAVVGLRKMPALVLLALRLEPLPIATVSAEPDALDWMERLPVLAVMVPLLVTAGVVMETEEPLDVPPVPWVMELEAPEPVTYVNAPVALTLPLTEMLLEVLAVMAPVDCRVTPLSTVKSVTEAAVVTSEAFIEIVVAVVFGFKAESMPRRRVLAAEPIVAVPEVTVIVAEPGLVPVPTPRSSGV